jgi:hypothetical protein
MQVLNRILERNIRGQISIDNGQSGFTPVKSRPDAIFSVRQVQEKLITVAKKPHYALVDLEKRMIECQGKWLDGLYVKQ